MLNHLRIRNFRGWKDTREVRLAPITVFFGTNSAGKSSIPQLLTLLKQTTESSDRQRVLHFGDQRTAMELGDYASVVRAHKVDRTIELSLGWTMPQPLKVKDPLRDNKIVAQSDELRFDLRLEADSNRSPFVRSMEYRLGRGRGALSAGMTRKAAGTRYTFTTGGYDAVWRQGRKWPQPPPVQFYGFPDEAVAYYQNTGFVADLNLAMTQLLKRVHYVGPLREYPRRLYQWSGEVPVHVGIKGDRAVEAILAAKDRRFNFGPRQRRKSLDEVVAERLERMDLVQDFEVRILAEHRKEYEVYVRTGKRRPPVLLTDVGIGVSQVLPVIVEAFYVPAHSVVIFEQPEIHLHPAAQAHLADLFIDAIKAREDAQPRDVQFIIESHSEHFLRRLQRRIAEEVLPPEHAALYFVHAEARAPRLDELKLDEFGRIANWPPGFFGDAVGETEQQMRHTMARLRRRREERSDG